MLSQPLAGGTQLQPVPIFPEMVEVLGSLLTPSAVELTRTLSDAMVARSAR